MQNTRSIQPPFTTSKENHMFTVTKYPHGTFCWADSASTDVDKARPFYTELMGWTVEESPMGNGQMYSFLKKDGHNAAAISPMQPEMQAQGIPSHWNNYVTVDDINAMPEKVTAAGGTVIAPPFDVLGSGRMMVAQDPTGAMINFWQPTTHIGASIVNTPGAMVWNELLTRDAAKAKAFYSDVLGWTFAPGPIPAYHMIHNNERANGGIMEMDAQWGEMPPVWQVYFAVEDIDAFVQRVPELGGKILSGINESGPGRFAIVQDPAGAVFAVIQMRELTPWEE
jgi:hypothetical protein